jgi:N6-L-threonylcarbamoyladenine synthase
MRGKPLMPAKPRKARILLRDGKAKVVKRTPFTIQLTVATGESTQPVVLGVDSGSKTVGLSATTDKEELYASECKLRNDITKKLAARREFRRGRRSRKTRYRKARFLNRKRGEGWLAPSVKQKIDTHLKLVSDICKILPISKIIVETAAFDIQKIKNPDIDGKEYQQGEQLGFWNVREYVLFRDGHTCQYCKGKSGDKILNVHHLESRQTGGDAPNNLITLCKTCHKKLHAEEIELKVKRGQHFKDATFMGITRWAFFGKLKEQYANVAMTFGYLTKHTRIGAGLEKSHAVDARCISGHPLVYPSENRYDQKAVRTKNRQVYKAMTGKEGRKKRNQAPHEVFGFRLFDKVLCDGIEAFVFGRRLSGSFDVRKLDGTKLSAGISYKKLHLLEKAQTILTERRRAFLQRLKPLVSCANF